MYRLGDVYFWKSKGFSEGGSKVEFVMVDKISESNVWLKKMESLCIHQEVNYTAEGKPYLKELYIPYINTELPPVGTFRRFINERCTNEIIASRRKSQKTYLKYDKPVEFNDDGWIYR